MNYGGRQEKMANKKRKKKCAKKKKQTGSGWKRTCRKKGGCKNKNIKKFYNDNPTGYGLFSELVGDSFKMLFTPRKFNREIQAKIKQAKAQEKLAKAQAKARKK